MLVAKKLRDVQHAVGMQYCGVTYLRHDSSRFINFSTNI